MTSVALTWGCRCSASHLVGVARGRWGRVGWGRVGHLLQGAPVYSPPTSPDTNEILCEEEGCQFIGDDPGVTGVGGGVSPPGIFLGGSSLAGISANIFIHFLRLT